MHINIVDLGRIVKLSDERIVLYYNLYYKWKTNLFDTFKQPDKLREHKKEIIPFCVGNYEYYKFFGFSEHY